MLVPHTKRRSQLVLINPLDHADDRHVVQRSRFSSPPASLACFYALALDAAERLVLGADVSIDITAIDESKARIRVKDILAQFARHHGFGMVGLVGVRSSQFPRALEIARLLRGADLSVVVGGFVSERLALMPDMQSDLKLVLDIGCSVFAGSAENGRIDVVIRDAADGTLKPVYSDVPALETLQFAPSAF